MLQLGEGTLELLLNVSRSLGTRVIMKFAKPGAHTLLPIRVPCSTEYARVLCVRPVHAGWPLELLSLKCLETRAMGGGGVSALKSPQGPQDLTKGDPDRLRTPR